MNSETSILQLVRAVEKTVSSELLPIPFKDINTSAEMSNKYVWGVITHLWEFIEQAGNNNKHGLQKLLLSEVSGAKIEKEKPLIVCLQYEIVPTDLKKFLLGDVLVISNPSVEVLNLRCSYPPEMENAYDYQLCVKVCHNASSAIWVLKQSKEFEEIQSQLYDSEALTPSEDLSLGEMSYSSVIPHADSSEPCGHFNEVPNASPSFQQYQPFQRSSLLDCCQYTSLHDIEKSLQEKNTYKLYNVYAFVKDTYISICSDGKCMMMSVKDPTLDDMVVAILEDLLFPDIYPGNIVCINKMKVTNFRGKLRGTVHSSKQVLVFDGYIDGSLEPISVGPVPSLNHEDEQMIQKLRAWIYKDTPVDETFSSLLPNCFGNVVCQVVNNHKIATASSALLQVWDGTKISSCILKDYVEIFDDIKIKDEELYNKAKGWLINIVVYDTHCSEAMKLEPGTFIKIYNIHLGKIDRDFDESKYSLSLYSNRNFGRRIEKLGLHTPEVQSLKKRLGNILQCERNEQESLELVKKGKLDDVLQFGGNNQESLESIPKRNLVEGLLGENEQQSLKLVPSRRLDSSLQCKGNDQESSEFVSNEQETVLVPHVETSSFVSANSPYGLRNSDELELSSIVETSPSVPEVPSDESSGFEMDCMWGLDVETPMLKQGSSDAVKTEKGEVPSTDTSSYVTASSQYDSKNSEDLDLSSIVNTSPSVPQIPFGEHKGLELVHSTLNVDVPPVEHNSVNRANAEIKAGDLEVKEDRYTLISLILGRTDEISGRNYLVRAFLLDIHPHLTPLEHFIQLCCPKCDRHITLRNAGYRRHQFTANVEMMECDRCLRFRAESVKLELSFYLIVSLTDGSGILRAILKGSNAVHFFNGLKPFDVLTNINDTRRMHYILDKLCPNHFLIESLGCLSRERIVNCTPLELSIKTYLNDNNTIEYHVVNSILQI